MGLLNIKAPVGVNTSAVASKVQNSKRKVSTRKSTGNTILDRVNLIRSKVELELGHLKDKFLLIQTEEELSKYILDRINTQQSESKMEIFPPKNSELNSLS